MKKSALKRTTNFKPVYFTKAGWFYIIVTIVLGFAAVNTGNNLIFIIVSFLLAVMAISGFYGKKNINNIKINLRMPAEIYAGSAFIVRLKAENEKKFLDSYLLKIRFYEGEVFFGRIGRQSIKEGRTDLIFQKRGINCIKEIVLYSRFPFNFFVRCKRVPVSSEAVVFPKPVKSNESARSYSLNETEGNAVKDNQASEELSSIRNYEYGDSLRLIHWKHFAKSDELKAKNFSGGLNSPVVIDLSGLDFVSESELSAAAYDIIDLIKNNIPVGLKTDNDYFPPGISHGHKLNLLRYLALYDDNK